MLAPCRSWFVADVSEDHTASIIGAEMRNVRNCLVYSGIGDGSGHWNWPVRARDEERSGETVSGPIGKSLFFGGPKGKLG